MSVASKSSTSRRGATRCADTNCSNSARWMASAASRSARRSIRHSVDGLASSASRPTAARSARSCRSSEWSFRSSSPSASAYTRWRSISTIEWLRLASRRGSPRRPATDFVSPIFRSTSDSSWMPPFPVTCPPEIAAKHPAQPARGFSTAKRSCKVTGKVCHSDTEHSFEISCGEKHSLSVSTTGSLAFSATAGKIKFSLSVP